MDAPTRTRNATSHPLPGGGWAVARAGWYGRWDVVEVYLDRPTRKHATYDHRVDAEDHAGRIVQEHCPHADSGYDDDEWTCWDCGAYRDESERADRSRRDGAA